MAFEYTITVTTTPTALALAGAARELIVQNVGSAPAFTGDVNVTAVSGTRLDVGQQFSLFPAAAGVVYAVVGSGTTTVRVVDVAGAIPTAGVLRDWSEPLGASGQANFTRTTVDSTAVSVGAGTFRVTYFRACRTELITNITMYVGGTAAGDDPTLVRYGLYSEASNGDITLLSGTTNDAPTTMLTGANGTAYLKPLATPTTITRDQRYATALIVVTAAAAPTVWGHIVAGGINTTLTSSTLLRIAAQVASQTDLPASVANASLAGNANQQFALLT